VLVECLAGGAFEHEALRYAHEALALDPYRETSYVRLMRLHMDRGNRAEACTSSAAPSWPATSA